MSRGDPRGQRKKPARLVKVRRDGEFDGTSDFVPWSIEICGADVKTVTARGEVRVKRLAARTRLDPIPVEPIELVAKRDSRRRRKAERGVAEIEIRPPGIKFADALWIDVLAVDLSFLDDHFGRRQIAVDVRRIDHDHSVNR